MKNPTESMVQPLRTLYKHAIQQRYSKFDLDRGRCPADNPLLRTSWCPNMFPIAQITLVFSINEFVPEHWVRYASFVLIDVDGDFVLPGNYMMLYPVLAHLNYEQGEPLNISLDHDDESEACSIHFAQVISDPEWMSE